MSKEIIGLTGPIGSGKTTASDFLITQGYSRFIFSDVIKEEAVKRGLPIDDRAILQDVGDDLRRNFGVDILAKRLIEAYRTSGKTKVVVDGIRNLGELKHIQTQGGFIIAVDSPIEQRFERTTDRKNLHDAASREKFIQDEMRDRGFEQEAYGQQTDECLAASDIIIENSGTIEEFQAKILKIL